MILGPLVTLMKNVELDSFLTTYSKINSIWIKNLHEKQNLTVFRTQYWKISAGLWYREEFL